MYPILAQRDANASKLNAEVCMYTFETNIRYSEVDESGRLSIPAIINLLQDCSTFHSEAVGMGPGHVRETGKAWMLSAWKTEVLRRPAFNARVLVSTWAIGFKGIRATRDFMIREAGSKDVLVRATSSWFMYDMHAGRPIRLPEEEVAPYLSDIENDTPLDMPPAPRRIAVPGEGLTATPVTVSGAHLDTNHHVNNEQYVSMALGALDELGLSETAVASDPLWVDVCYANAAKLGDTIYPQACCANGSTVVSLEDADGKPYATVRLRGA